MVVYDCIPEFAEQLKKRHRIMGTGYRILSLYRILVLRMYEVPHVRGGTEYINQLEGVKRKSRTLGTVYQQRVTQGTGVQGSTSKYK